MEAEFPNPARILIVDDSAENRLLLSSQLRMDGYEIIQAPGGQRGIEMARSDSPDLILLDVMMPEVNGFEVCEQLKADPVTSGILIIMITALREVQYRIRGIKAGANEFLSRPHHREELVVRVRSLIRLKRTREMLEEERNRLQLLYSISRATTTQLNLQQMMAEIISYTQAALNATRGSIFLFDESRTITHKITVRAGEAPKHGGDVQPDVLRRGLAGWLIRHNRGDIIADTDDDKRWVTLSHNMPIASAVGVPLSRGERQVGVMIMTHEEKNFFKPEHLAIAETIGGTVSAAIDNAYLFGEISDERSKLSAILSQSSDAIFTTDESKHIDLFNHAAATIFGLAAEAAIGEPIGELSRLAPLRSLFANVTDQPLSEEVGLDDGRTLFASITPIQGVGYVVVMQDISMLKQAEQKRLDLERREKSLVKQTFSRYMGTRLVDHVLSYDPQVLERRERRGAVVMFADLRGFTRMIVEVEPNQAIQLLNSFFSQMTDIVHEFDGTIFDLAGDELMVGFNVPFDQPDAAYRAFLTAVSMQLRFDHLRQEWHEQLGTILGLGIGIDAGEVIVGNVGARQRMNFAMVGEAVNTSHRLVDIANDAEVIISATIYEAIANKNMNFVEFKSMGAVAIEGKPEPEVLYRARLKRTPLREVIAT